MKKYGKYEKMPEGVPAKKPKVKSALLQTYFTSLLCMVLCVTMFFGTSYAWFTSEVTNEGNEIYIGTLDVDLQDGEGNSLEGNRPIFDGNIRWEPGYTALETIKVVNKGELAFRYELTFTDGDVDGTVDKTLAEVAQWFDVWYYHDANNSVPTPENYAQITVENGWKKVGSLADVLKESQASEKGKAVFYGNMTKDDVVSKKETIHTYTIALHMNGDAIDVAQQETLNALMGQKIGLNVKLVATQLSGEQDAFGAAYDMEAFAGTLAQVNDLEDKKITYQWGTNGSTAAEVTLDTAYQFLPNDTLETIADAPYKYYHADFVVKADKDVPDGAIALAGYYQAWCELVDNRWVALTNEGEMIEAGTEIRLVEMLGVTVNYEEICRYGNDGIGFKCGAVELKDAEGNGKLEENTTLTVELRLYETTENGSSTDVETGRYITVGSYEYTFE